MVIQKRTVRETIPFHICLDPKGVYTERPNPRIWIQNLQKPEPEDDGN